jgi:MFS family permease
VSTLSASQTSSAGPKRPTRSEPDAYSWYVLAVLTLAYVFNYVDRNILNLLLQPIKEDLGASDTAMGFLTGFAFAAFYAIMGLPIARWADTGTRRSILAIGLAAWSGMTVVCGLARSFTQLALARVGVGIGEAAGTPPSHSLISDYFPPHRRGIALSVYSMANYGGLALGFAIGGYLASEYGWRWAFIAMGVPGILLAVVVRATVREPARGAFDDVKDVAPVSTREALAFLSRQRSYLWLNVAGTFSAVLGYGYGVWGPTFLARVHGMGLTEIGLWLGVLGASGGLIGTLAGGALSDRLTPRDLRWYMWIAAFSCLVNVPVNCALLFASTNVTLALYFPHSLIHGLYVGPLFATMQVVARPQMRALVVAIHLMIVNLIGLGLGPLVVGMLNDALDARLGDEAIRYSLLVVTFTGAIAGFFYLLAARTLREDVARVSARSGE